MDTDEHGLREGGLTRGIIGAAMEVLNELGHGLLEKPYENEDALSWKRGGHRMPIR